MKSSLILAATIAAVTISTGSNAARDYIEVVGSSTVFPFSTVVAETFGKNTGKPTPKIESTGTGGGMKLFCKGDGIDTPDMTNASRRIKSSEFELCIKNGVTDITEVLVGFDGIAFANAIEGPSFSFTLRDIYLALAAKIPGEAYQSALDGTIIDNPFTHWNQINTSLPAVKIKVLGPPPTSGTRDALQELAIEGGCKTYPAMKEMKKSDSSEYKKLCRGVREDGAYVEMGENDNLIISKLIKDKNAIGVFGFSFLDQNGDKVKGSSIGAAAITFESIANGDYPVSRPLYFYVKNSHRGVINGLDGFVAEFVKEETFGEEGYLADKGLIPSPADVRSGFTQDALNATKLAL
tara:strand:+ start:128 stop:1180 length:1053 start_codon:yes stop_codon:yes gene_type:complete